MVVEAAAMVGVALRGGFDVVDLVVVAGGVAAGVGVVVDEVDEADDEDDTVVVDDGVDVVVEVNVLVLAAESGDAPLIGTAVITA